MKTKQLLDAEKKDAVFQASIEFIGTLTGMKPPPIETAPPETFAPFRAFTERVCEIFAALEADIAKPVEPVARLARWMSGGDLGAPERVIYSVKVLDAGRALPMGDFLLYTTLQEPAAAELLAALREIVSQHGQWNNGMWAANIASAAIAKATGGAT